MPASRLLVPSTRLSRIARLVCALQRCATGSPARWNTAWRPDSASAGAASLIRSQATACTSPSRSRARSASRLSTVTSASRCCSAATSPGPSSPVAPVTVTRRGLTAGRSRPSVAALGGAGGAGDHISLRVAHLLARERGAGRPRLLGHRRGDRGGDVAVEDRRDDVVLAQLALVDDRCDRDESELSEDYI